MFIRIRNRAVGERVLCLEGRVVLMQELANGKRVRSGTAEAT